MLTNERGTTKMGTAKEESKAGSRKKAVKQEIACSEPIQHSTAYLKKIGLTEDDIPAINAIARKIDYANPIRVSDIGKAAYGNIANHTDHVLSNVNAASQAELDTKFKEIIKTLRIPTTGLSSKKAHITDKMLAVVGKVPMIGGMLHKAAGKVQDMALNYKTALQQITTVVSEVTTIVSQLTETNMTLDEVREGVITEFKSLGRYIAAQEMTVQEGLLRVKQLKSDESSEMDVLAMQEVADIEATIANMNKRIADMKAKQVSAMQLVPAIRIIQKGNQRLQDRFDSILEFGATTWKNGYVISAALSEQSRAVLLANMMDDATNAIILSNARTLKGNAIEIAKASQRMVIDVATLEEAQQLLFETISGVMEIRNEEHDKNMAAITTIERLQNNMAGVSMEHDTPRPKLEMH
jgi:uncharacterized protein YaaN involved in tellurite resistance